LVVPSALTFVYRSHRDGPLSKRVVHLPHASLLDWFREGWVTDPRSFVRESLRGSVYGLSSVFERAQEHGLPVPTTRAALMAHLYEHLYVEGEILHDDHTLRVMTDDDAVRLAYFFFDAHTVAEHADALAYLLHEEWPLPAGGENATFTPGIDLPVVRPAGDGEGATYVVLGTFYDSNSMPGGSFVLPGVRLPGAVRALAPRDARAHAAHPLGLAVAPEHRADPPRRRGRCVRVFHDAVHRRRDARRTRTESRPASGA
jgi:hypothetical protein